MKPTAFPRIETLESRISPAALVGNVLTYTDVDGDRVKLTFTNATMEPGNFFLMPGGVDGDTTTPQLLTLVSLSGKTGGGFTMVATPQGGKGDSHANIRSILGGTTDLGTIKVDGDVTEISCGSGAVGTVGLKSFTALSIGRGFGAQIINGSLNNVGSFTVKGDIVQELITFTGGVKKLTVGGSLLSTDFGAARVNITGDAGAITIGGSVIGHHSVDANLEVSGNAGTLSIGGSVIGGSDDLGDLSPRQIIVGGAVKNLSIGGDLIGGEGLRSGSIMVGGTVKRAKIGGSVFGGDGSVISGNLEFHGAVNSLIIAGSLVGGTAEKSGVLNLLGGGGTIKIGGSLMGGPANETGSIFALATVTSLSIGRNLQAANSNGATLTSEGAIIGTDFGSIAIGGDLLSGEIVGGGALSQSGFIGASGRIGAVKIGGSIVGDPDHLAYITAGGSVAGAGNAIASITVKGAVQSASLLAGYDALLKQQSIASGIGTVKIGGNLSGSFITVGSDNGSDGVPGNADDLAISTVATIGSVKVGGAFTGVAGDNTNFRIYGPVVNQVTVGRATYHRAELRSPGIEFSAIGVASAQSVN